MATDKKRLQAQPTEYKGIVYRSKSEAMFARWLELDGCRFEYEPEMLQLGDGYRPDFLSVQATIIGERMAMFQVIEYKPSLPTQTYIDKWADRAQQMLGRLAAYGVSMSQLVSVDCVLYYGSFHGDHAGSGFVAWNIERKDPYRSRLPWTEIHQREVLETRFDLVTA